MTVSRRDILRLAALALIALPGTAAAFDAFEPAVQRASAPETGFLDPEGRTTALGAFRGRVVLLNLWATWCAPCRAEMPALDALQDDLGGDRFIVLTVSVDTGNGDAVRRFLENHDLTRLAAYRAPKARLARALGVSGYPTTFLIGPDSTVLGRIEGPVNWSRPDARTFLSNLIEKAF